MFITNDKDYTTLSDTIKQRIKYCHEIKILVGYFYFGGMEEILNEIQSNEHLKLKILIGLDSDIKDGYIIEFEKTQNRENNATIKQRYYDSIRKIFTHPIFDNYEFHQNIITFLNLIKEKRIEIRKTREPNHTKLYIFQMNKEHQNLIEGFYITGSSNLTKAGLKEQKEFNVCIRDFGWSEANKYFDQLWNNSIHFTEDEHLKIIEVFKNETLIKEITPFEAYLYVLKTYIDSFKKKPISESIKQKLRGAGYTPFQYQLDAIAQALSIIEEHNGVIIADVVGLGKSVIACAIAYELKERGLVIAPPGLIGDDTKTAGWKKYLEDFGLSAIGWEAHSLGKLEDVFKLVKKIKDFSVVIIDEAHRFRNQDTQSYDLLKEICRNKKVILLTATPFNNRPSDIFSLLKLFITPKKSSISLNPDLESIFDHYGYLYNQLLYIKKNLNSTVKKKKEKSLQYFYNIFQYTKNSIISEEEALKLVNSKLKSLAEEIKNTLIPVMIRRNRLDLKKHPDYKKDLLELSKVKDPIKGFYFLNRAQSEFYDEVINRYFIEHGEFRGAIYMPFRYIKNTSEKISEFDELFQTNLYNLMRRLLVKRFESSFGAFYETIQNFINIHNKVINFIKKTGYYILDREWINKISEYDEEEFLEEFQQKMNELETLDETSKAKILYSIEDLNNDFLKDIHEDLNLLNTIRNNIEKLQLIQTDPKADAIIEQLNKALKKDPKRKIIIFSEYQATVKHLAEYLEKKDKALFQKSLIVVGNISSSTYQKILENFDASYSGPQKNDYDILICTDKLSEGFNLNRAGFVINYDIPWNPVRVIQRLGRINRIGKKVFDELYIMNFFPTEQGEDIIKQEKITESKMFMIHNSIGEDAKIFSPDETPTPSELFNRINKNPEDMDEESTYTKVYLEFENYKKQYPNVVKNLYNFPPRIKTAKLSNTNELITLIKKYRIYFVHTEYNTPKISIKSFEEIWDKIKTEPQTPSLSLSAEFWKHYETSLAYTPQFHRPESEQTIFKKALNNLRSIINNQEFLDYKDYIEILIDDLLHYGTLSDYRLRQIAQIKNTHDLKKIIDDLGNEYFTQLAHFNNTSAEVIVSIENQATHLLNSASS
ncbi:MAG: helicase-related protein [Bacteroidia bacterium]|nr:helicase-related protein [Bacteroidia bacterium]